MSWNEILIAVTPPTGLVAIAIWRFARLEASVKHQHDCQKMLVRAVSKLNVRYRSLLKEVRDLPLMCRKEEK